MESIFYELPKVDSLELCFSKIRSLNVRIILTPFIPCGGTLCERLSFVLDWLISFYCGINSYSHGFTHH